MYDYGYGSYAQILLSISLIAALMCVVFWIFRFFCGHFNNVSMLSALPAEEVRPNQTTLRTLFCLTSVCAVLFGVAIPVAPFVLAPESANLMVAFFFVPGMLFLPMLFSGKKRPGSNAFKHLFLLCSMIVAGVLASVWFFSGTAVDGLFLALIFLLGFFTAGATVIGGLTMFADWGYRVRRPARKTENMKIPSHSTRFHAFASKISLDRFRVIDLKLNGGLLSSKVNEATIRSQS